MSELTVTWRMPNPPVKAASWHNWDGAFLQNHKDQQLLEQNLGFPVGTVAYLEEAFRLGLSRVAGWNLQSDDPAGPAAATIYKRGVYWRDTKVHCPEKILTGSYKISLTDAGSELEAINSNTDTLYIIDSNVYDHWPKLKDLKLRYIVESTELDKTLHTVGAVLAAAKTLNAKNWAVIGGGLLADITAFAASLVEQPISFFPTTLLAMADACVGGKTGVNFSPYGKNQLGSFYFPKAVTVWEGWLESLPRRELLAGAAECYKHAYLSGNRALVDRISQALAEGFEHLGVTLAEIIRVKADVVAEDPTETGRRAILNFGHTIGHALEAVSQELSPDNFLLHGEAVAIGMVFASILSREYAGLPDEDHQFMVKHLKESGCMLSRAKLMQYMGGLNVHRDDGWDKLCSFLEKDKKKTDQSSGSAQWVLLSGLGKPYEKSGRFTMPLELKNLKPLWDRFINVEL